jgi:catechol 2,3-dioxygenase
MTNKRIIIVGIVAIILMISLFALMKNNSTNQVTYDPDSPSVIGDVHLIVSDLDRSVDFYQNMIGFNILKKETNKVTLTADGSTPLLVLEEDADSIQRPNGTTGLFHFAILLPDRTSLARVLIHLTDSGYPLQGASNHQYSDALYLADPEDNGIEIYVDLPPEKWKQDGNGGYEGGTYPIDIDKLISEAGSESWSGLPSNTRVGHMHLQVAELEMTEKFYVDGLGFDVTTKGDGSLFVSKKGYHHHIGLNTWAGTGLPSPPDNARGLKQFTLYFTQEEIDNAKLQLQQLDFAFEENNGAILVKDPSGNAIQILKQ